MLEVRSPGCARAGEVIVPARGKDPEEASIVDDLERYEQHEQHDDDGERDARAAAPARWRPRRELRRHERGGEKFGCGSRRCKPRLLSRRGILVSLQVFRTRLVQHARLLDAAHLAWTRRAVELDLVIGTRHGRLLLRCVRGLVARTSRVKERVAFILGSAVLSGHLARTLIQNLRSRHPTAAFANLRVRHAGTPLRTSKMRLGLRSVRRLELASWRVVNAAFDASHKIFAAGMALATCAGPPH